MITTTMNIATRRNANSIKHASVLFLCLLRRARRVVRSALKKAASDCPGHGTDGLGGEYAGNEASASVAGASSTVASA